MTTTYPTELEFGIATANIQNLKDLSRTDTRAALRSVRGQAGIIGFQETIEAGDNEDIDLVFLANDYAHFNRAGENDQIVRRSRWSLASDKVLAKYEKGGLPTHGGKMLASYAFNIGTFKEHVQPQRKAAYTIYTFDENPLLTPVVHVNTHLISGVDSNKEPVAYRHAERHDQYAALQHFVLNCAAVGLQVIFTADTNWVHMPKFSSGTVQMVNSTIDKIWFIPSAHANWNLEMLSPERIKNPSDHDAFVANVKLTVNKNYVVPAPVVPHVETTATKVTAWATKYGVTGEALADLDAILKAGGVK